MSLILAGLLGLSRWRRGIEMRERVSRVLRGIVPERPPWVLLGMTIAAALLFANNATATAPPAVKAGAAKQDPHPHPHQQAAQRKRWNLDEAFMAWVSVQRDLEVRLRNSASPRDRALSTQLVSRDVGSDLAMVRGRRLREAARAAPDDALVAWLWAQAAPENSGCDDASPCPDRILAPSRKDPGNLAGWLLALQATTADCDAEGTATRDGILAQAAAATRYDLPVRESMAAWADVFDRYPGQIKAERSFYRERLSPETERLAAIWSWGSDVEPGWSALEEACDRNAHEGASARRHTDCQAIARTLLDKAPTIGGRFFALSLLDRTAATPDDLDKGRTLHWLRFAECRLERRRHAMPGKENGESVHDMAELVADGDEMTALQRKLAAAGVAVTPPARWHPTVHGRPVSPLDRREATGCPEPPVPPGLATICPVPAVTPSVPEPVPDSK